MTHQSPISRLKCARPSYLNRGDRSLAPGNTRRAYTTSTTTTPGEPWQSSVSDNAETDISRIIRYLRTADNCVIFRRARVSSIYACLRSPKSSSSLSCGYFPRRRACIFFTRNQSNFDARSPVRACTHRAPSRTRNYNRFGLRKWTLRARGKTKKNAKNYPDHVLDEEEEWEKHFPRRECTWCAGHGGKGAGHEFSSEEVELILRWFQSTDGEVCGNSST